MDGLHGRQIRRVVLLCLDSRHCGSGGSRRGGSADPRWWPLVISNCAGSRPRGSQQSLDQLSAHAVGEHVALETLPDAEALAAVDLETALDEALGRVRDGGPAGAGVDVDGAAAALGDGLLEVVAVEGRDSGEQDVADDAQGPAVDLLGVPVGAGCGGGSAVAAVAVAAFVDEEVLHVVPALLLALGQVDLGRCVLGRADHRVHPVRLPAPAASCPAEAVTAAAVVDVHVVTAHNLRLAERQMLLGNAKVADGQMRVPDRGAHDEDVVELEVTVDNPTPVEEVQAVADLVERHDSLALRECLQHLTVLGKIGKQVASNS